MASEAVAGENRSGALKLSSLGVGELDAARSIISDAIEAWPTPARLKRNVIPVLAYDRSDLDDYEILLVRDAGEPVAITAWQRQAIKGIPGLPRSSLLHGLYIARPCQKRGIGTALLVAVARRAMMAGHEGLLVKAERFAINYFEQCGFRRLQELDCLDGLSTKSGGRYPHQFWQACASILSLHAGRASDVLTKGGLESDGQ